VHFHLLQNLTSGSLFFRKQGYFVTSITFAQILWLATLNYPQAIHKRLLMEHFKFKKLRKRQYFLQEGDVCKYIGFIVKGSARTFTVDEKGHENILKLALENWWLADFESFTC
jgi:CRP-like cAMP-binding protein